MLVVKDVHKRYAKAGTFLGGKKQAILSGISFSVKEGECMGLVGESGSGKSTLSRLILGLETPCQGEILMENHSVSFWNKKHPGRMSVVFQDYTTSVNSRFTVAQAIAEPLRIVGKTLKSGRSSTPDVSGGLGDMKDLNSYIPELLDRVELPRSVMTRRPHELSGGQLQRVCIARAIAARPRFILFDEALSSLDAPVQAQVLDLLSVLKKELALTYFFIAHDLLAVAALCDRVLFLHQGKIVEAVETCSLHKVRNSYARALLDSARLISQENYLP